MNYKLNDKIVRLNVSGSLERGQDDCLILQDDNLIEGCSWEQAGYIVDDILSVSDYVALKEGVKLLISEALCSCGVFVDESVFTLEDYHKLCPNQAVHLSVIEFLRMNAALNNLPIDPSCLDQKISQICGKSVSSNVESVLASGYFFIRIVRPERFHDNNPPHKDVWIDRLRHALNLYLPIAGSNQHSSLSVVEGSHLWPESRVARTAPGASVNGVRFSVPAAVSLNEELSMLRPNVAARQGLVFSPYLLHGGAVNLNTDKTRVSLEIRFWRS